MVKFIEAGGRVMDRAWMRDNHGNIHTGEALLLALLLHAKGTTKRDPREVEEIAKLLDDPNVRK
jgi:hypothetical protein